MDTDLNARMIERLKASGAIRSAAVEAAFRRTLRHLFVPGVGHDLVYSGNALVTRSDPDRGITSSSSETAIMAPMLETLRVEPGHRVLEIGAGTGYNAALLDELVGPDGSVTTIDNQPDVTADAREHLAAAGHSRVAVLSGDGYAGAEECAPYDRIIATASVRDIPLAWRDQLREGGLLVVPLRFGPGANMVATFRREASRLESVSAVVGGFMPLRTGSEALEEPIRVDDLNVSLASTRPADVALLAELLHAKPVLRPFDTFPVAALFSLAGLIERDWLVMRPTARNGMWQGVFDRDARGVALISAVMLPDGTNRATTIVFGSSRAAERLEALVTELATIAVDRVQVRAVPSGGAPPSADMIVTQPNFTYAIDWRAARASSRAR